MSSQDEQSAPAELSKERLAAIEANRERAKKRRLQRYLEQLEEDQAENIQQDQAELGGGFIPDDQEEQEHTLIEQAEVVYPLEANEGCKVCGSIELDDFIRRHYRVRVCGTCREAHPDRFSLLTKTAAKEEFLLTDEELRDGERVPHVSKPNPLKPTWSNMQLFLREHLVAFAIDKWGSLEGVEEEAQRRADAGQASKEKRYLANLKDLRRKTKLGGAGGKPARTHNHKHQFVEGKDPISGQVQTKCSECGFAIVSEEL